MKVEERISEIIEIARSEDKARILNLSGIPI